MWVQAEAALLHGWPQGHGSISAAARHQQTAQQAHNLSHRNLLLNQQLGRTLRKTPMLIWRRRSSCTPQSTQPSQPPSTTRPIHLEEDAHVDLAQAQQLQDLLGLGVDVVHTADADLQGNWNQVLIGCFVK